MCCQRVKDSANFVARLRAANPTKRPVMIMGHMDVVGVDTAKWKTPPFTATIVNEPGVQYLYGRGAIDDKGMLSAATAALQQPRRGVISSIGTSSFWPLRQKKVGRKSASMRWSANTSI